MRMAGSWGILATHRSLIAINHLPRRPPRLAACRPGHHLAHGAFQRRDLERLAQTREARFGRGYHIAVAGGEQDAHGPMMLEDFLGEMDAVDAVGHDDVAEYEIDRFGSCQVPQRLRRVLRTQRPVAELLD